MTTKRNKMVLERDLTKIYQRLNAMEKIAIPGVNVRCQYVERIHLQLEALKRKLLKIP
jgi:vacuolar-type H+-ATPase subunit D/Vma8